MGKARGGNRVPGKGTRNAAHENRPGPMEPGADIAASWREGDRQHAAIGRAPLGAKRMHKGRLPFRIGYLSLGASFTSCPRFATTGMVMAFAGQASTQALQRVQSASVRSP